MNKLKLTIPLLAALLSLFGCQTTDPQAGREIRSPLLDIAKGSHQDDLIAALGKPTRIEAYADDPERVKIWVYETESSVTEMITGRYEETPYFDPITLEERTIKEPVFLPKTRTTTRTLYFYVIDEKVFGWKVEEEMENEITD
ncbi:hypothetical protein QEH56_08420 [Pelagicoccus enzymogenes]|uniref:hypothetical protein n=1 Tax=Pelagicoccus enzymogenes TaxID=2773457 RepID=UPI00280CBB89|nr:hypothetical protein [Pelagicoccus enzymogenes]MDQ8198167.1 hypothetical protein [Pelagicoccus enzymogenes]